MSLRLQANWLPKAGSNDSEYEDAFAFQCRTQRSAPRHAKTRLAIADGATDSWCSGLWATLLVNAAIERGLERVKFIAVFEKLRQRWKCEAVSKDLNWACEEKARGGAHAAILWLTVSPPSVPATPGGWCAASIGDCCLFHLRGGLLVKSFPYSRPEQFGSRPILLSTNGDKDESAALVEVENGEWQHGDRFLLATDALALWFMQQIDETGRYSEADLDMVATCRTQADFAEWTARARESGQLRNDDTTFLHMEMG